MATSEGIPSSIDIEFLELNDNPYIISCSFGISFLVFFCWSPRYVEAIAKAFERAYLVFAGVVVCHRREQKFIVKGMVDLCECVEVLQIPSAYVKNLTPGKVYPFERAVLDIEYWPVMLGSAQLVCFYMNIVVFVVVVYGIQELMEVSFQHYVIFHEHIVVVGVCLGEQAKQDEWIWQALVALVEESNYVV